MSITFSYHQMQWFTLKKRKKGRRGRVIFDFQALWLRAEKSRD